MAMTRRALAAAGKCSSIQRRSDSSRRPRSNQRLLNPTQVRPRAHDLTLDSANGAPSPQHALNLDEQVVAFPGSTAERVFPGARRRPAWRRRNVINTLANARMATPRMATTTQLNAVCTGSFA